MLSLHCWRRDIASLSSPRGHYTYSYCFIRHSLPWCTALHIACIHNLRFIHHTLSQDRAFTTHGFATLHRASVPLRSVVHYPYSSQASSFFKRSSQRVRSFHYPYSTIIRYGSRPTRLYLIDWWRQIVLIIVIRALLVRVTFIRPQLALLYSIRRCSPLPYQSVGWTHFIKATPTFGLFK